MADQDQDRSENATPFKLEKARKEGMVAKSADINAAALLAALVGTVYALGPDQLQAAVKLQQSVLTNIARIEWSVDGIATWLTQLVLGALQIVAPLFLVLAITAILVNLVQTGPLFSAKPLSPDMNRLNPATGFKRVFSMRTLYESGKGIFKLVILAAVAYFAIADLIPGLVGLSHLEPRSYAKTLLGLSAGVMVKMVAAMVLLAVLDFSYTRWEYAKRMRMSRRDVRDEVKQREGDPRIRARLRELRKEMLKRSKAMRQLPSADVLITNPTHIAVALRYKHGEASAPQLVAKGAGDLARRMREIAGRHQIPIIQNRTLARALFREVDYDGFIPQKLFPHVAKIMVWVYVMREAKQRNRGIA
jgi:flagellar biosynthetic protein FlhB